MRFHLLALPNFQTTRAYSLDGFCAATIRFARLLKELGHTVMLYASEENEAPCDELITCITKEEQQTLLGKGDYQYAAMEGNYPLWALMNPRIIKAIGERKQPRDFIVFIGGVSQQSVAMGHPDLMAVEYSIGYVSSCAKYRVFESETWRALSAGAQRQWEDASFQDAVIPLFFDEDEFPFRAEKEPFLLYVGRLTPKKGLSICCRTAYEAGVPLKVIGHGDPSLVTHGAELLGAVSADERNEWMSRASALICPTLYMEPFGAIAVEAQLCGTPVISTDFGAFVETVEQGKTGFRCHYLGEFIQAAHRVKDLDPAYIRRRAIEKYSIHTIKHEYQRYFDRLSLLWDRGWETKETPC